MDGAALDWVRRFVEGINHYQDGAAELPHEFRVLGLEPEPWTIGDVLAIGRLAGTDVNWLVWADLLKLRARDDWPELWARLVKRGKTSFASFDGGARTAAMQRLLGGTSKSGSNSVAVSGRRSATGGALIANDPHPRYRHPQSLADRGRQIPLLSRGRADGAGAARLRHRPQPAISPGAAPTCAPPPAISTMSATCRDRRSPNGASASACAGGSTARRSSARQAGGRS